MTIETDPEEIVLEFNEDEIEDDHIDDVVTSFERIMQEQLVKEASIKKPRQLRRLRIKCFKEMMKAAFLSNSLATEKDFKRLWPRIFDESLIEFGRSSHLAAMERVFEELSSTDDVESENGDTIDDAIG